VSRPEPELGLFDEADLWGPPVSVIAVCHRCGARGRPGDIPLTESGNPGDPWTGVTWGWLQLEQHEQECPER
jgi:hypothetical protein